MNPRHNHTIIRDAQAAADKAVSIIDKCKRGSNAYGVFLTACGTVAETRDNSTMFCRWEVTGKPWLIGKYSKHTPVDVVANDILKAAT